MSRNFYRRHGYVMVLRAAALPVGARPDEWPDVGSLGEAARGVVVEGDGGELQGACDAGVP
ncbi:hypothetical protein ABZ839_33155 [Streptomyces cellulosae]